MSDNSILLVDGATFRPNKQQVKFIQTNASINSFIESGLESSKALIVGQKGSGKSVIIRYKKYIDKTEDTENKFFIPSDGIEKIDFNDQLSAAELTKNVKYEHWEKIFKVSIYYFILCKLSDNIIEDGIIDRKVFYDIELHNLLNPYRIEFTEMSLGTILYECVSNRSIVYENNAEFIGLAQLIVKAYIKRREVRVYLDNLDQALHTALNREESTRSNVFSNVLNLENTETDVSAGNDRVKLDNFIASESFDLSDKSVAAWFTCHIGFLLAIYNVNSLSRRISVYSTFRLEAYEYFEFINIRNKPQYRNIVSTIEYTDHDFKNIYLNLLSAAGIKKSSLENMTLDQLPHLYVQSELQKKEPLWNFVRRHTFLNPREITFQINVLKDIIRDYDKVTIENHELQNIFKNKISEKAFALIIKDLCAETLPFFPTRELFDFYTKHKKNFITKRELNDANRSLVLILYRLGLVGVLNWKGKKVKQKFLAKNVYYTNESRKLPESEYYLFHPTLDHILVEKYPKDNFYYPWCIIGNGLEFELLREVDYYMPKIRNNSFKDQFAQFHNLHNSFDRYKEIENSILKTWAPKIWSYRFDPDLKNKWCQFLSDEVNNEEGFHSTRKVNTIRNLNLLARNYKLRVVISLSSLVGLITDHKDFMDQVFEKNKFPAITYFGNVKGHGDKLSRYLGFMSEFEINILIKVIESPIISEKLERRFMVNTRMKYDYQELIVKIKSKLSRFKIQM